MEDLSISDIILILKSKEKEARDKEDRINKIALDLINLLGHSHIATKEAKKAVRDFFCERHAISQAIEALEETTNKGT